ncbi:MAG: alpha/beta hydrolase [Myxococcales bacterium]|nr:alpha/beta hydrolase [Myxococcales bacterium]
MKRLPKNWPTTANEVWSVPTEDGWTLGLHVYGDPRSGRPPVALFHGALSNSRQFDIGGFGLANFLVRHGFVAFAADFRGRGYSLEPPGSAGWDVDDLINRDVPAVLRAISRATGYERVDAVGHSLGGMSLLGYMGVNGENLGKLVSLGGTVTLDIAPGFRHVVGAMSHFSVIPIAGLGERVGFISKLIPLAFWRWCCNPKNVPPTEFRQFLACGSGNISVRKVRHLQRIAEAGRLVSADGSVDYSARLGEAENPVRIFGAIADTMVSRRQIRHTHSLLASSDAEIVWCGRERGFAEDYGHLDLVMAKTIEREVFAEILHFLRA